VPHTFWPVNIVMKIKVNNKKRWRNTYMLRLGYEIKIEVNGLRREIGNTPWDYGI